jgi:hypothetical protein
VNVLNVEEYLARRRRTIFWDEHLWYAHLLVLWLAKDHVAYGSVAFLAVLAYGGACMGWSYLFYWRLERRLLLGPLLASTPPGARRLEEPRAAA